jgi:multidrug efflux system outer membrane protein
MNKTIINLSLITALSSCTMIPGYKRPEAPVEKNLGENVTTQEKLVSEIKWQDFFKSPNLQKIIKTTLENNRDLRVAVLNIDAAQALYRVKRADLLPSVNAQGGITKQKNQLFGNQVGGSGTITRYEANVATAFEIDLFGKIRSQNQSALEAFFATKEAKNATQIALIAEVSNAYLQLLADQKILDLAKETVAAQEKSYQLIAKKFEYGVISKLDLAQSKTGIETAKANQALYYKLVEQDKNTLVLLMGVKNSDVFTGKEKLEDIKLMENLPVGLSSEVLFSRPDIMQAEHQLKSANANIGAARAAFFPSISLTGSVGYASTDLSNLFSGASSAAWSFSPSINLPIFEGGKNIANLDYAKISKNIYIAKYEKAIQTAFREVADELAAKKNLDAQMAAQNNLAEAASDAYKISSARYSAGIDSFINVADSQRTLFSAQQNQIALEKEKLSNLVRLYKVLGGGVL